MPSSPQDDQPFELKDIPLSQKFVELLLKVMTPSSGVISGLGSFILLPIESPPIKAIFSIVIGSGITLTGKFLKPLSQASQEKAEDLGKGTVQMAARLSEQAIAKITNVDDRYAACQAAACETISTEGLLTGKLGGLFTPMLDQVYVPLELDRSAQIPGLWNVQEIFEQEDGYASPTVDIWKLLALADRDRVYRQLAILAWGGYGKTTLFRHLAFTLGKRQQPESVPPRLPVLLLLRKYREVLTQENPPSLPELITHEHFASLPATKDVSLPRNWAERRLKAGKMVVMIDGFDEVPKGQRGKVAQWINQQIEKFERSLFIVTSRPKAYTEQAGEHQLNFSTVLWVKDFQEKQRQDFVHRWYWCQEYYTHGKEDLPIVRQTAKAQANDLLRQIQQRPELADLSKNPLLLNMLAMFHRCNPKVDIPKRRTDVFQGICQLWLKDRPEARGLDLGVEDWENAQIILQQLALAMMEFPEPRIERSDLLRRLTVSLQELEETVEAREFLEKTERISEMLIQREAGEYEFPHNSFQEFLAAKEVLRLKQESIVTDHFGEGKW
ncbi:MAG: NACHT domain-containing protein [Cyanobacteria bacterium P01_F01_bin.42]